eukprot:1175985-Prorocentrum_minimum.AAC.11
MSRGLYSGVLASITLARAYKRLDYGSVSPSPGFYGMPLKLVRPPRSWARLYSLSAESRLKLASRHRTCTSPRAQQQRAMLYAGRDNCGHESTIKVFES